MGAHEQATFLAILSFAYVQEDFCFFSPSSVLKSILLLDLAYVVLMDLF